MAITERDVVLTGKENGCECIDLPVTRVSNIEDNRTNIKETPVDTDALPIIDSEDGNEMKKIAFSGLKLAVLEEVSASIEELGAQMDNMATLTTPDGESVPYSFSINNSGGLRFTYGEAEA